MPLHRFFIFLFILTLSSCLETEDPNKVDCIDTNQITAISVISRKHIKEIKVFIENDTLCKSNSELLYVKKLNKQYYHYSYENCTSCSESNDWFVRMGCYIKQTKEIENGQVYLLLDQNEEPTILKINDLAFPKSIITLVSELDTSWLFSHEENMTINKEPDYNFFISSHLGCYNDYCLVSLPISQNEFCFDTNNENMKYLFE